MYKAVHDLPHDHHPLAAARRARWGQRFDQIPFVAGEIVRIERNLFRRVQKTETCRRRKIVIKCEVAHMVRQVSAIRFQGCFNLNVPDAEVDGNRNRWLTLKILAPCRKLNCGHISAW